MIITLKNGKNVDIQWNFMFLEFLEEYPGGFKALKQDYNKQNNLMKIHNHFLYSIIRANVEEPLKYREVLSLIETKDMKRLIDFVVKNFKEMDEFKKKDVNMTQKKKKKK